MDYFSLQILFFVKAICRGPDFPSLLLFRIKVYFFNVGFNYCPRYNFLETENLSVSLGVPLSVGFSFGNHNYNTTWESNTKSYSGLFILAPAYINLNIGRGSTKINNNKIGYFLGAGMGYYGATYSTQNRYTWSNSTNDNSAKSESISTSGFTVDGGFRFRIGKRKTNKLKSLEIRLSYMKGGSDIINQVYGVHSAFNF